MVAFERGGVRRVANLGASPGERLELFRNGADGKVLPSLSHWGPLQHLENHSSVTPLRQCVRIRGRALQRAQCRRT